MEYSGKMMMSNIEKLSGNMLNNSLIPPDSINFSSKPDIISNDLYYLEKEFLCNNEEILSVIFSETLILITDIQGIIKFVNDKCCETLGYNANELIGKHTRIFKTGLHTASFYKKLWKTLLEGKAWKGEMATRRKDGSFSWNFMSMYPLKKNNQFYGLLTLRTDITEQKQMQKDLSKKIKKYEYFDSLTGLPNGKSFSERLKIEIDLAKERNRPFAIVHLNLDDFKYVKNTFGNRTGNQLLIDFSMRMVDVLDQNNASMFRLGGDSFLVLIKGLEDFDDIPQIVTAIKEQITKKPFETMGNEVYLTACMGVSVFPFSGENEEALLKNAETAMYRAKSNGKNQFLIFSPMMSAFSYKQFTLRNDSKKALMKDEYCVYYQPRFNPVTDEMVSAEALIRWNHPRLGIVSPSEFILFAEESGLIVPIGEWLIRKVCDQITKWEKEGFQLKRISINLSSLQLLRPNFAEMVTSILREFDVESQWIEFEITETAIISKELQVLETLNKLRNQGITIALDDFGTGYSSLNYLRKFPCEIIKLDKILIDEIHRDQDNYEIIASTINLCHKLKKSVVAEGVENAEQLSLLKELKIDEIQGYFYSRPIEEHQFRNFLKKSEREDIVI